MAYSFLNALKSKGYSDEQLAQIFGSNQPIQPTAEKASALQRYSPALTSIIGAILGSALGPAGTVAGSALGGGLGKGIANVTEGKKALQGVGKETLIGGVAGGVGEALNLGGRAAMGALRGAAGRTATQIGTEAAAQTGGRGATELVANLIKTKAPGGTIAKGIGGALERGGEGIATRSVGATPTMQREFADTFGKTVAKALQENNAVGRSAEDFTEQTIRPLQTLYTNAVESTNIQVPVKSILNKLDEQVIALNKSVVPQSRDQALRLQEIRNNIAQTYKAGKLTAGDLNALKQQFQLFATPSMKVSSPVDYNVNNIVSGLFRDELNTAVAASGQKVAGMNLKEAGKKLNELYNLGDIIDRGQFKGGRGAVSWRQALLGTGGFVAGGPAGAAVLAGGDALIGSPLGASLTSRALTGAGETLQAPRSLLGATGANLIGQGGASLFRGEDNQSLNTTSDPTQQLLDFPSAQSDQSMGAAGLSQLGGDKSQEIFLQLMLSDLTETGGKNIDKIATIAKFVQPAKTKPLTAEQSKTKGYASRLAQANQIFDTIEPVISQKLTSRTSISRNIPDRFKGDVQKQQEQAERNFINAVLRRESGAAISPTEFDSAAKQYFPQPGDTKAVLAQKRMNRLLVQQSYIDEFSNPSQNDQLGTLLEQLAGR